MTPSTSEPQTLAAPKIGGTTVGRPVPSMPVDPRLPEPDPGRRPDKSGRLADLGASAALAAIGALVALAGWQVIASLKPNLPSPAQTLAEFQFQMASPLHDNGPNDKGIFLMLGNSIFKVFSGFILAALVGIPLGFAVGSSRKLNQVFNPLIQVLRPVSPLAWYPLALTFFLTSSPNPSISIYASIMVIALTALWPTLINTAAGVASIPEDHKNVAKVFRFSRAKYIMRVLLPFSMGSILTGLKLSMGIAWLVIVAVEMLSGGAGIGFFVWDRYNNSNLPAVVVAIFFIGAVGLILDLGFRRLAGRFDYAGVS
ncbi:MAG: nitrate ABC transporter permease [Actinomycetota bacterium]